MKNLLNLDTELELVSRLPIVNTCIPQNRSNQYSGWLIAFKQQLMGTQEEYVNNVNRRKINFNQKTI